jgi:hypothetical protein
MEDEGALVCSEESQVQKDMPKRAGEVCWGGWWCRRSSGGSMMKKMSSVSGRAASARPFISLRGRER